MAICRNLSSIQNGANSLVDLLINAFWLVQRNHAAVKLDSRTVFIYAPVLKKKPQLRTNQNARSTEFIILKKIYGNFFGSKLLQCPCTTVWSQCMKDTTTAPLGRSASFAPGLVNPRHITLAPLKRNLIAPLSTCWCGRITGSMIARSNKLSWFDASLV